MTRLPDKESSAAVLFGCEKFESAGLADLPAVGRNLTDLEALLTRPGTGAFDQRHTHILRDGNCGGVLGMYQALRRAAKSATDTFLVYYAGHGLTSMRRNELYLCLTDTDPDALTVSGLSINSIRELFLGCPARNRILILDCCFSGRATSDYMASTSEILAGQSEITGTYTLASAPPTAPSLAPVGERYTAFTGALIEMLRDGEPSGPELLTLDVLYYGLWQRMNARGFPLPTQRGTDLAHHLAIGQNPAYTRGMISSGQINQEFPETAPGVLALLGDLQHAIDEAMAIPYPMSRVGAISEIAIIISAHDPDKAKELAITAEEFAVSAHRDLIPDDNEMRLLQALVSVGLVGRALEMVMNMEHPESRALGFAILATAYAGTPERAEILVAEAEKSVSRIDRSGWTPGIGGAQINQARFYAQIANILAARLPAVAERTLAKAGDTARSIHDADSKKRALTAVAEAVSSRLPEQAARFSEEADRADN